MLRVSSTSPAGPAAAPRRIPRRTWIAFGAAACVVTIATVLFGPSLRTVLAQSDESAAAYWRAERTRQTNAVPQQQYRSMPVRAYAPAQHSVFSGLRLPSVFRAGLPGGPQDNLAGAAADERQRRQPLQRQAVIPPTTLTSSRTTAMCVRLCDGFHFPAGGQGLGPAQLEASCNSLCPNAPTRLYYTRSDKIENAVAARTGKTYSALPVANRYASTRDNTCSCRNDGLPGLQTADIYRDRTLRRGDPVMTENGFRIFKGSGRWPYRPRDFAALGEAQTLPPASRRVLSALERASGVVKRSPVIQQAGPYRSRADLQPDTRPSDFPPLLRMVSQDSGARSLVRMIGPQAFHAR